MKLVLNISGFEENIEIAGVTELIKKLNMPLVLRHDLVLHNVKNKADVCLGVLGRTV